MGLQERAWPLMISNLFQNEKRSGETARVSIEVDSDDTEAVQRLTGYKQQGLCIDITSPSKVSGGASLAPDVAAAGGGVAEPPTPEGGGQQQQQPVADKECNCNQCKQPSEELFLDVTDSVL